MAKQQEHKHVKTAAGGMVKTGDVKPDEVEKIAKVVETLDPKDKKETKDE